MNKKLVVGSGALACLCYALLFVLLLSTKQMQKVHIQESMDIALIMDTLPTPASNPFQDLGVSSMFASIPDKEPSVSNEAQNQEHLQALERTQAFLKNISSNQHQEALKDLQNSLSNITEQLQTLQHKSIDFQIPKEEKISQEEYQAWFQEIYKILYGHWKLSFKKPASVGALITISANGQFSFAIVEYSPFADYNREIENLLASLQTQKFPPYPKGSITLKVNFKTKDQ
ncbi:TonB C-terminal domain-containing protein [Helicobacter salomonis]|uniref:TonB C-terminal domain-containing protein n=1 Tax=Helicobacter salomonis TaxID=56878 RepID=UPI000CF09B43|nr:TonB C-terminal domain-containing protein [Helicobacter salomonis]